MVVACMAEKGGRGTALTTGLLGKQPVTQLMTAAYVATVAGETQKLLQIAEDFNDALSGSH